MLTVQILSSQSSTQRLLMTEQTDVIHFFRFTETNTNVSHVLSAPLKFCSVLVCLNSFTCCTEEAVTAATTHRHCSIQITNKSCHYTLRYVG